MRRGPLLLLFALSGAAALVYEVVWTRLLTLQIGHGLAAASTVLAAFMGGLAIGAASGGRIGQRLKPRAALRGYALLEVAIAVVALVLPLLLAALAPLLSALYDNGAGGLAFGAARIVSSLVLLSLPAAAMGATFPLASRWQVRSASLISETPDGSTPPTRWAPPLEPSSQAFVLLPLLGLNGATLVGVALNLAAAGGAWMLASRSDAEVALPAPAHKASKERKPSPSPWPRSGRPWLAAAALGVTGFASLVLQVVWTRLLASMLGPTTYAFSAVVAIFILGIAGGSAFGRVAVAAPARANRRPGPGAVARARRWRWHLRSPSTPCSWPWPSSSRNRRSLSVRC